MNLQPGTYYITPWTDLYSAVLQDTLAMNVNPDDPNNLYSDNYKAAQIAILAPLPDLIVTSVTAPAKAQGGDNFTVNWTVENDGNGVAGPTGWIDTVYLTNDPTNPLDQNAITMTLGSVEHDAVLNPDASYNASLTVELSPSAVGQYIVVYTDAPQPNLHDPGQPRDGGRRDQQPQVRQHRRHPGAGRPGRHERLDPDRRTTRASR